MTLTHHKAVDLVRSRHSRIRLDSSVKETRDLADARPTPEDTVAPDDERSRVRMALSQLRPDERHVIVAAYFDGWSQSEIAARHGIPLGTVKSRTLSGLRRLRDLLPEVGLPA